MKWLETHKQIVMVLIVVLAVLWIAQTIRTHFDGVAHDERVIAEERVKADLAKAQLDATRTAQDKADLEKKLNALNASNAQLANSLAALRSQLAQRQEKDKTLPPDELAQRWSVLSGVLPGEFQAQPNGILASLTAARATVVRLEENDELHEELKQKDTNSAQKDTTINALQTVLTDRETELVTAKKTITDERDACKKTVADVKNQARKGKRNAFISGVVIALGAVLGLHR